LIFNCNGSFDTSFDTGLGEANYDVRAIKIQDDGKIIIGGYFTSYNGTARGRIARINSDGTLDDDFDPGTGFGGPVYAIEIQDDGKIFAAGQFTLYNGTTRRNVARININGALDTDFDPGTGASSGVAACAVQDDGKFVIGGVFTTYNGTARNRIARINSNGTLDTSFNPGTGANAIIYTIIMAE
jgi:uncharacterized delta-60 repeat protein